MYTKFEEVYLNIIKEERMSEERQKELYELALNLFENYKWNSDEALEAFQADYPSFRRDFIDAYSNYPETDEEFIKEFTETMDYYNSNQYLEESKKISKKKPVIKENKKVDTKKKVIKESLDEKRIDELVKLAEDIWNNYKWKNKQDGQYYRHLYPDFRKMIEKFALKPWMTEISDEEFTQGMLDEMNRYNRWKEWNKQTQKWEDSKEDFIKERFGQEMSWDFENHQWKPTSKDPIKKKIKKR